MEAQEKPEKEPEEKAETGVRKQPVGGVLNGVAISSEAALLRWAKRRPAGVCWLLHLLLVADLHEPDPVEALTVEKEKVFVLLFPASSFHCVYPGK